MQICEPCMSVLGSFRCRFSASRISSSFSSFSPLSLSLSLSLSSSRLFCPRHYIRVLKSRARSSDDVTERRWTNFGNLPDEKTCEVRRAVEMEFKDKSAIPRSRRRIEFISLTFSPSGNTFSPPFSRFRCHVQRGRSTERRKRDKCRHRPASRTVNQTTRKSD